MDICNILNCISIRLSNDWDFRPTFPQRHTTMRHRIVSLLAVCHLKFKGEFGHILLP